jgi:integrase
METTTDKKKRTAYKEPKFYLDAKSDDKAAPIFLKFTFAPGQRLSYFVGERIEPSKWNSESQRVKRNVNGATEINDILDALAETASKAVREARLNKKTLHKETLKALLDDTAGRQKKETTFLDIFKEFIESETKLKSWTIATQKKLRTVKTQLEAFETEKRKTQRSFRIDINQMDGQFFEELISFWQTEYSLRNSSIQKYIKLLRWFLTWSAKKGYSNYDFKTVDVDLKQSKRKVIFLDMDELKKIQEAKIPASKEYLVRTRDVFLFQCFTGLRFSDLLNLKASEIGDDAIKVNTIKTGEEVEIQLNDITKPIIEKYKQYQEATGKALPVTHNQVYNRFLKELAKLAGIKDKINLVHYKGSERIEETFEKWQLICTHTARRSFITNGLTLGIGSEVIRSWTGHQSEKSFKDYFEIVKSRQRTDMDKFKF